MENDKLRIILKMIIILLLLLWIFLIYIWLIWIWIIYFDWIWPDRKTWTILFFLWTLLTYLLVIKIKYNKLTILKILFWIILLSISSYILAFSYKYYSENKIKEQEIIKMINNKELKKIEDLTIESVCTFRKMNIISQTLYHKLKIWLIQQT